MVEDDYRVRLLPDAEVQTLAATWRKLLNQHFLSNCLDIPALFKAVGDAVGWPIKVELRPDSIMGRANAFVAPGAGTVFIRQGLIDAAAAGDPEAVYDGTHELAHVILHRKVQVSLARMATRDNQHKFLQPEESAEHQANVFARSFLMTDEEIALYRSAEVVAEHCYVPVQQAMVRIEEHGRTTGRHLRKMERERAARELTEARVKGYETRPCPECRNFSLVRSGACLMCDTCGGTSGCS